MARNVIQGVSRVTIQCPNCGRQTRAMTHVQVPLSVGYEKIVGCQACVRILGRNGLRIRRSQALANRRNDNG